MENNTTNEVEEVKEYTDQDLIKEPASTGAIGSEKHEDFGEKVYESVKRSDSVKVWTVFNTFVSVINMALLLVIFMVTMLNPV